MAGPLVRNAVVSLSALAAAAAVVAASIFGVALATAARLDSAPAQSEVVTAGGTYQGKSVRWWARRAVQNRKNSNARGRTIERLRRIIARQVEPSYVHMISVAATAYGVPRGVLERKARCESVNFSDFYNERSRASGVMQFLPSTWRSTPFAGYSIFDPLANIMAGAWMHDVGRGDEWACR